MPYHIVFDNTGDEILFDPVNQDLLDFYLDHLDQLSLNSFLPHDKNLGQNILSRIFKFKKTVTEINCWLYDLADTKIELYDDEQYLNQDLLNKMHADWVRSINQVYDIQKKRLQLNFSELAEKIHDMFPDDIQMPPLYVVIDKLGWRDLYDSLNNPHIHVLEGVFDNIRFTVSDSWTKIVDNPFDKKLLTNNHANLCISFNHLGRTLYNKYQNFDEDLKFDDENSFNELLGDVTLSFKPSQTIPLSAEYVAWCKKNNREPIGHNLNIGNIPDLYRNVSKYRILVFKNLLAKNKFSIHKG